MNKWKSEIKVAEALGCIEVVDGWTMGSALIPRIPAPGIKNKIIPSIVRPILLLPSLEFAKCHFS